MTFQADIITSLLGNNGLSALIGDRLWPDSMPDGMDAYPFIVVWEFAGRSNQVLSGAIATTSPLLQFVIYDSSYGGALAVADALRAALLSSGYLVSFEDERSIRDMTTGMHRRDVDVVVTHV